MSLETKFKELRTDKIHKNLEIILKYTNLTKMTELGADDIF